MKEVAFLYDFDLTLSPMNMQEFSLISDLGLTVAEFWNYIRKFESTHEIDLILSYLFCQKELYETKFNKPLTKEILNSYGKDIKFYPGVKTWFMRMNAYAAEKGIKLKHYIISSGMKEIIDGTCIADEFEKIFASTYIYNENGNIMWPGLNVNYTNKTQFVYRINKGTLDIRDNTTVNSYIPHNKRVVPFQNIAYFGDGESDVPCMKVVKQRGGYAVGVYAETEKSKNLSNDLIMQNRVTCAAKADYSKDSKLESIAKYIIDKAVD
ncbi:MAG: haloacid dehalogenase-like hydrolase [Clostridia bacterium]